MIETNNFDLALSNQANQRAPLQPKTPLRSFFLPGARTSARLVRTLPAYSMTIGTCDDGLPFVLDLQDPTAGPVLVSGDAGSGKTALLRLMVSSAMQLNSPREAQFVIFSPFLDEWDDLIEAGTQSGHCLGAYTGQEREAGQMILELSALADQRRDEELSSPAILLVMDDFTPLLSAGFDVQVNLHWLLNQGSLSRIWPIVAINAGWALNLHYWIDVFRTRLLGKIQSAAIGQKIAIHPGVATQVLRAGVQFTTWVDERWMRFWMDSRES
ncbi:MAG TPA: hypothetical protein VMT46_17595 [Anaerolineaceae bacterium]|nr:hypothetical protein [Anaerolineaceae bacterium]